MEPASCAGAAGTSPATVPGRGAGADVRAHVRRAVCVGFGVRGHENVRKRVLIQAAACNIGLLQRRQTGVGTPGSLQGRAVSAICRLIGRLLDRWGRLRRLWGFKWTPTAFVGSIAHSVAAGSATRSPRTA